MAQIGLLLLIAALVAMISRRLHLPYTVGLVLAGLGAGAIPNAPYEAITRDLLFTVLLPPLIFEAALLLPWSALRDELLVVVPIATVGLALAALATGSGLIVLFGWPPRVAAAFSVLIAATDPVSVIATFKEARVTGRLRLLVEAESLFNDGTAAVLFGLAVAIPKDGSDLPDGIVLDALWIVGGGIACGGLLAGGILFLAGRTKDHLVEITLTTVAAYGSFLLGEHLHCSGILATLTAGLVIGHRGPLGAFSPRGREAAEVFWEFAAFVSNSLIFLLLGVQMAQQDFLDVWGIALGAIILVTLGRAVAVYPLAFLFHKSRLQIPSRYQHVMFWGGLRGALSLALAQGLPDTFPLRREIVTVTFAVVAFSVLVQGLSMPLLLRRLEVVPLPAQRRDMEA